jgi:hypothetical protein
VAATQETKPAAPVALGKVESPFFTAVVEEPALQGVDQVIVPSITNPYFLVVKHDETTTTVERWSITPLEKKGELTVPYFPTKPSLFTLGPKGDFLVTLVRFPKAQLELTAFDGRTPKKVTAMDNLQVMPKLVGFFDANRFALRADFDNNPQRTALQVISAITGRGEREIRAVPQLIAESSAMAISPNGRYMAGIGTDRLLGVYNLETGQGLRQIMISNTMPFRVSQVSFSPDSTQVAVYAVIGDIPTVMAFKVTNGEATSTSVASKKPQYMGQDLQPSGRGGNPSRPSPDKEEAVNPNEMLWLLDGKYWLVNGNDIVETATGKRLGSLNIEGQQERHLLGTGAIMFVRKSPDNKRDLVVAKIDANGIKAAAEKR